MDPFTLLSFSLLGFVLYKVLTEKESNLKEDPVRVGKLLDNAHQALSKANGYVGQGNLPDKVIEELDSSLCKLMCNIRDDKEESIKVSVLYGHFKHVLDEFQKMNAHSEKYAEIKHHLEEQYGHIQHELITLAQKRGIELAGAHGH